MPREEVLLEDALVGTKSRKSHKKCGSKKDSCNVECCISDCNPDCCTPAFQRLDKLRTVWLLEQYNLPAPFSFDGSGNPVDVDTYNRAGQLITDASPIVEVVPQQDGYTLTWGSLELAAYAFVNEVRYLNFEECGKLDQVVGWSVDVQTGNLYFYQNLPELGLTTSDSRSAVLNTIPTSLTPYDKRKLAEMEPFWKLSLKAIERVRENPKTEGNICEIKDKCGNRFLVAINRADGQDSGNSICEYNSQYSIVAVKLC
jgi:hypothetical protein